MAATNPTPSTHTAKVHLTTKDGPTISKIELTTEADVPDLGKDEFADFAQKAKEGCPVSKALASVSEVTLDASLV